MHGKCEKKETEEEETDENKRQKVKTFTRKYWTTADNCITEKYYDLRVKSNR